MTLPKELGDREYQSYGKDANGEVARKVTGNVYIVDAEGNTIGTLTRNKITKLLFTDIDTKNLLQIILKELQELNKKLDIIIG